jgi:AcrR family transcriptional regulator
MSQAGDADRRLAAAADRQARTVDAVMNAMDVLLRSQPWSTASTQRLADLAGVSANTVYRYFTNKETIAVTALQRRMRFAARHIRQAVVPGSGDVREDLRGWVRDLLHALRRDVKLNRSFVLMYLDVLGSPQVQEAEREVMAELTAVLVEALSRQAELFEGRDVRRVAQYLLMMLETILHRTLVYEPDRLRDAAFEAELLDLVQRYVLPAQAPEVALKLAADRPTAQAAGGGSKELVGV